LAKEKVNLLSRLKERLGWSVILDHKVPKHSNDFGYCLGGLTLSAITVLVVTGVILEQFYHPAPEEAYATIDFVITQVSGGAFVRNLHFWAAQFATVIVGLHMIRVLVAGAYKKPRELQWLVGAALLFLTGAFMFTGTVLKWDQEAVEGLGHNVELAEGLGALGYWFVPNFARDVPLLTRLFVGSCLNASRPRIGPTWSTLLPDSRSRHILTNQWSSSKVGDGFLQGTHEESAGLRCSLSRGLVGVVCYRSCSAWPSRR